MEKTGRKITVEFEKVKERVYELETKRDAYVMYLCLEDNIIDQKILQHDISQIENELLWLNSLLLERKGI